jgi:hypothetical protein
MPDAPKPSTPLLLPLRVRVVNNQTPDIWDAGNHCLGDIRDNNTAQQLVHACNGYPALEAENARLRKALESLYVPCGHTMTTEFCENPRCRAAIKSNSIIDTALGGAE